MRTVWPRLLAGLVAGVLLLGGCGENPEPKQLPKPSKSSSPSASASPSPPVMPAAAKEKTKAGAIAFAEGFIDALNYAGATGDTKVLRALFLRLCTRCEAIADGIDRTYDKGGSIKGGEWHATRFKFYAIKNDVAFVDAWVDYDAQSWTKAASAKPMTFPASRRNLKAFNLRWTSGGWKASALDPQA